MRTLLPPRMGVSGATAGERDRGETSAARLARLSPSPVPCRRRYKLWPNRYCLATCIARHVVWISSPIRTNILEVRLALRKLRQLLMRFLHSLIRNRIVLLLIVLLLILPGINACESE